jgi:hypothetical protein
VVRKGHVTEQKMPKTRWRQCPSHPSIGDDEDKNIRVQVTKQDSHSTGFIQEKAPSIGDNKEYTQPIDGIEEEVLSIGDVKDKAPSIHS